eukprot:TRINITY_DN13228_c0_g1_i2.p1 TRINITY_DN13228_c0_g1~~TRINITY_DN13228_c0_g1_i2.p1  ORF type:complete len:636 (+),score=199.39 TRINITY_DN13228_c0_g1_i2:98-2005(+)
MCIRDRGEGGFVKSEVVTAHVVTWNVKGSTPGESLEPLLDTLPTPPDLYVIGLQEIVDFNVGTVVLYETGAHTKWAAHLTEQIALVHGPGQFEMVAQTHLVGVALFVLAHRKHRGHISDVSASTAKCGLFGMLGNKGAGLVRMKMHGLEIAFVCSHLNSGQKETKRRNADYHDLNRKLSGHIRPNDTVVWLGDLNYRVDVLGPTMHQKVLAPASEHAWADIVDQYDQLVLAQRRREAFVGYAEARINFGPTYRLVVGTHTYDEKRLPAWTDRVLWSSPGGHGPACLAYRSHPELVSSDHKPVSAMLAFDVLQIDHSALNKAMDEADAKQIPSICLDPSHMIDYGTVHFFEPASTLLVITNNGQCPAPWQFAPKIEGEPVAAPWLTLSPEHGTLAAGDSVVVTLQLFVQGKTLQSIQGGALNEILVLHLQGGRDFFVEVQAELGSTCAGESISELPIGGSWHHGPWRPLCTALTAQPVCLGDISMDNRVQEAADVLKSLAAKQPVLCCPPSGVLALIELLEALPQPLIRRECVAMLDDTCSLKELCASLKPEAAVVLQLVLDVLAHIQVPEEDDDNECVESVDAGSLVALMAAGLTQLHVEFGSDDVLTPCSQRSVNRRLARMLLQVLQGGGGEEQ